MANSNLKITIDAKICVDKETAETCLRLAALYANANGARIVGTKTVDGEMTYDYVGD